MDFAKLKVKVMNDFKDGNVLGGRLLKAGEVTVISQQDFAKVIQSGGTLEILETMIPNPRQNTDPAVAEALAAQEAAIAEEAKAKEAEKKQAQEVTVRGDALDKQADLADDGKVNESASAPVEKKNKKSR